MSSFAAMPAAAAAGSHHYPLPQVDEEREEGGDVGGQHHLPVGQVCHVAGGGDRETQ